METINIKSTCGKLAALAIAASAAISTFGTPTPENTPDYFVEWVQPSSANLYVDTGVRGKTGVKAEVQYLFSKPTQYPVMLGSWGNKRFNLIMNNNDNARWEYGESMSDLGNFAYEGALCTAEVEVSAAGLMSGTWTNSQGKKITPTKDAVAQQGVIDTGLNLYLFASNKNGSPSQGGKSRLYYCKLWQGDTGSWTLVRNLRPCVKNGVAGLYDSVEGVILYPSGNTLVAGPVAYDRIATWNGGATPTAAELGTAANWTCTDKSGASLQSVLPDKATLVMFPDGIGSVTLPAGYAAPWGAVKAEGSVAHPATQYGTCANGRVNVVVPAYGYTVRGEGNFSDLINARSDNSARKLDFGGKQMRHDGWFYVNAAQAGTWAMTLYVDDYYAFYIDDVQVLSYHTWDGGVNGTATCEVSEGWHRFTSIIGDTGGGWGTAMTFGNNKVPFIFAVNGTTYSLTDDVTFPKGSGTSTITLSADADWSALGKVALQGGARIDLNGHSLVVDDVVVDDYLGTCITNSAAKKSVLYFTGDPLESKAYAADIIKQLDEKIILAHDGDQIATWTGAVSGDPANANNWQDLAGEPVVPTAAYAVKISGNNVNLQAPSGTDVACKSFEVGNCTFTADCDWRGLSHTPMITGTANLNGHNLHLPHLAAAAGSSFANSVAGTTNEVRFTAADTTYSSFGERVFIDDAANLSLASNVRIALVKEGDGTFSSSGFSLGTQAYEVDFVQTNGTANHTSAQIGISGHHGVYRMSGGTVKATGAFEVGPSGVGEFVQTGGNVTLQSWFNLGRNANGNGTYTITGGKLLVNKESYSGADKVYLACASNSKGTLNVGGNGEVELKCHLSVGKELDNSNGGKGCVNVYGNGSLHTTGDTFLGETNCETGEVTMDGGMFNVDRVLRVGESGSGVFTLNGGALSAGSWAGLGVNGNGTGTFRQNGGTFTMANNTLNVGNDGKGWYYQNGGTNKQLRVAIGANNQNNANGTYDIKGGLLDVSSYIYVGGNKVGQLVIGGDGVVIANGGVTIANGQTGSGTLTVKGGVLKTTFLRKGAGTLNGITFDGGTIVATNVTDGGANFITGLNNVKYGTGGLTLDTAGYDVTMATAGGATVMVSDASTFTKTGNGTLTVTDLPPVGNMVVSNGTLALSATCDNTAPVDIAHRWSFTSDLTDSVTGTAGTMSGSGATYDNGVVKLPGGNKGTCYINLGANTLPSDSVTIEAWFTLRSLVDWTRVFVIAGSSGNWTVFNSRRADNGNACNFDSLNGTQIVNTSGKVLAKDTPYYVAVTYTPDGNGGVIEKQYVKKVGDSGFIWNNTVTKANWSVIANAAQDYFWLGHSNGDKDKDTNADYDEVRVWRGALDDTAIALSAQKGPDATAADIAEIAASGTTVTRSLTIAAGATLDVGAGNTLRQSVLNAGGTLAGGNLVVTERVNATVGETMTVASGATLDLSDAEIVVTNPEALTRDGFTLAVSPSGGIVPAAPRKLSGPLAGYSLFLSSNKARIGKSGLVIIVK